MRGIEEPDALGMVERDLSMLFILSLFIIIFVFLGFMKIRWMEASIEEDTLRNRAQAEEETVQVFFGEGSEGAYVEVDGTRYELSALDPATLAGLAEAAAGKRVEIVLEAGLQTRHWFPVSYSLTKRARSVEFSAR